MSSSQIDDFYCECDKKDGLADFNLKTKKYTCLRCGKEYDN